MTEPIILASQSQTRGAMLRSAGVEFATKPARADEDSLKAALRAEGRSPRDIADALAEMKALKVSASLPGALVIGSDQILDLDGQLISKAQTMDEARARLLSLAGKNHKLHSAAVIALNGEPIWRHVSTATMSMHRFSDDFLDKYLAEAGPEILGSVGCYHFEATGARLFVKVAGDHYTILGMPLLEVLAYLRQRGTIEQ